MVSDDITGKKGQKGPKIKGKKLLKSLMVAKKNAHNPCPAPQKLKEQEKTKERFTIENPLLPYLCILFKFSFYLLILLPNPAGG